MPNGSNCALVDDYHSWNHIVGVLKKNYCYECANDMLAIHYIGDIRKWQ